MSNRTEISTLGEFGLIRHLTDKIELKNPSTLKGVGDDAAVLDYTDKQVLVTTDLLLEGIHFDLMMVLSLGTLQDLVLHTRTAGLISK